MSAAPSKEATRALVGAVADALRLAMTLTGRGADAHNGAEGIVEFHNAGIAIYDFMNKNPEMAALRSLKMEADHE